jgi:hypothetical protein
MVKSAYIILCQPAVIPRMTNQKSKMENGKSR